MMEKSPSLLVQECLEKALESKEVKLSNLTVTNAPASVMHNTSSVDSVTVTLTEKKVHNLFVKKMAEKEELREFLRKIRIFDREALFYSNLVPDMKQFCSVQALVPITLDFIPACYCASLESELLIMENLSKPPNVYQTLPTDVLGHPMEYVEATLRALAALHAVTYVMDSKMSDTFLKKYPFTDDIYFHDLHDVNPEGYYFNMTFNLASQVFKGDPVHADKFNALQKLRTKVADIGKKMVAPKAPFNVLCHGDLWNNNIMYHVDGSKPIKAKLMDWQALRYAPLTADLNNYLYANTTPQFRKQHLNDLLKVYYNNFQLLVQMLGNGRAPFTLDELLDDFKYRRMLGFMYFLPTLANKFDKRGGGDLLDGDINDDTSPIQFEDLMKDLVSTDQRKYKVLQVLLPVYEEVEEDILSYTTE